MTFNKAKLLWAKRLMRARFFVVLTDTGSAIGLRGVNPESIEDVVALKAQQAEIKRYAVQLQEVIDKHDRAINELTNNKRASSKKPVKA